MGFQNFVVSNKILPYIVLQTILEFFLVRLAMLPYGLDSVYQITCQPVNQAICIFITVPIVFFCNLVSIKYIIIIIVIFYIIPPRIRYVTRHPPHSPKQSAKANSQLQDALSNSL